MLFEVKKYLLHSEFLQKFINLIVILTLSMNKKVLHSAMGVTSALGLALCAIIMPGCDKETEPQQISPNTDYITRYMEARDTIEVAPLAPGFAAYFDFSDGVNMAYNDPISKDNLHNIVNAVTTPETDFYMLGNHEMKPMTGDSEQIFQDVMNPKNYEQQAAPIRKALQQIVEQRKPALLVTDYEEYDGEKIFKGAYAKQYFIDWLKQGYDITFYIVDYTENDKRKKLFYTVFDGKEGRLLKKVQAGLDGKPVNYKVFTMGNNNYKIITDYPAQSKGGNYHNADGEDNVTEICEDPKSENRYVRMEKFRSEYYPMLNCYQSANRWASELAIDSNRDYPPHVFRYFVQNLFISTDDLPYKEVELGMNVYDVQSDYESFDRHLTAIKEKPQMTNDDPYYDAAGNLKPEFAYVPAEFEPIHDLFLFVDEPTKAIPGYDKEGGKKHDGFREIGFTFDPNFETETGEEIVLIGKKKSFPATDLVRVDIVIREVEHLKGSDLEELFKWGDYDNLSESVRLALHDEDVNPVGKVLYTYYISPAESADGTKFSEERLKAIWEEGYPKQYEYYEDSKRNSDD